MNQAQSDTQKSTSILEAALTYVPPGWPVIPLWWPLPGGRCACGNPECDSPGKHPILKNWVNQGSTDPAKIRQWCMRWPRANVGILTGEVSGILLLDVDTKDDGPGTLAELEAMHGKLPDTVEAITGSGGRHVLFKYPTGRAITNRARFAPGLDTRSNGGMFVAAPSLHSSGPRYEWDAFFSPEDTPLADCPEWLISLMEKTNREDKPGASEGPIPKGKRNADLTSMAGTMRRRGMGFEAIFAALLAENNARCIPPLDEKEVQRIAESVSRYASAEAARGGKAAGTEEDFALTDLGNARRLVFRHGKDLRYCYTWKKWLVWDGRRWVKDDTGEVIRRAKDTVKLIYVEAAGAIDEENRKALARHALRSESEARIKSMVALAESELPVAPEQLDVDPWVLNVLNGTLDLKTGELREHRREDYITKLGPVQYDPAAECPTWHFFLNRIMNANNSLIIFLQKAVGYALTGDTREQVFFLLHGCGSNGKSTFVDTILAMIGEYGIQTPTETFMAKERGGIPNDIARLRGARFVAGVETDEGRRMAETLVKQLTGGDTITARFLHQEFFEFKPTFKIFVATNHRPQIKGSDFAIWRRIRLIPFDEKILPEEQDRDLSNKLRAELPGILRWALIGCLAWQEDGLGIPDEVKAATDGYKAEMDIIAGFIDDCCLINPIAKATASALYKSFREWCESTGEKSFSQRGFGMRLTERGFSRTRGTAGRHLWEGIGLVSKGDTGE